jgi:hypothetical protein
VDSMKKDRSDLERLSGEEACGLISTAGWLCSIKRQRAFHLCSIKSQ